MREVARRSEAECMSEQHDQRGTARSGGSLLALASAVPSTKVEILRLLLRQQRSARSIATELEIHPSVIRRHLNELRIGRLVELRSGRAAHGRPPAVYNISDEGRGLLASRYEVVFDFVLRSMVTVLSPAQLELVISDAALQLSHDPSLARTEASALNVLREMGFEPELRSENAHRAILSRNCPLMRVAKEHPTLMCENFHTRLLANLFGSAAPVLQKTLARGDPFCLHELS